MPERKGRKTEAHERAQPRWHRRRPWRAPSRMLRSRACRAEHCAPRGVERGAAAIDHRARDGADDRGRHGGCWRSAWCTRRSPAMRAASIRSARIVAGVLLVALAIVVGVLSVAPAMVRDFFAEEAVMDERASGDPDGREDRRHRRHRRGARRAERRLGEPAQLGERLVARRRCGDAHRARHRRRDERAWLAARARARGDGHGAGLHARRRRRSGDIAGERAGARRRGWCARESIGRRTVFAAIVLRSVEGSPYAFVRSLSARSGDRPDDCRFDGGVRDSSARGRLSRRFGGSNRRSSRRARVLHQFRVHQRLRRLLHRPAELPGYHVSRAVDRAGAHGDVLAQGMDVRREPAEYAERQQRSSRLSHDSAPEHAGRQLRLSRAR